MKVLSLEQMNKLKELGVDVSPKELCLVYTRGGWREYRLKYQKLYYSDDVKAFTLQDIIELLPYEIKGYYLAIAKPNGINNILYISDGILYNTKCDSILQASYQMLIRVIENGYLKTK